MKLIHTEVIGNESKGLYFELNLYFNDNKFDGERGYYLEAIPVKIGEDGLIAMRFEEISKRELFMRAKRETEAKLKEVTELLIKSKYEILEDIENEDEYMKILKDYIEGASYIDILDKKFERDENIPKSRRNDRKKNDGDKDFEPVESSDYTFESIAGLKEVKEELYEIVDAVKNKDKYIAMDAKVPRGVLLYGPPGTGKTLIGKALSNETNSKFFYVAGSEFTEKYVGVGAKRVRDLFKKARKESPSIVFIDEIDAIGSSRTVEGNNEKDQTLNQLLVEMDGFNENNDVIVMATTNRINLLDSALTRPGRFNRHIYIGNPDLESRKELFAIHTKKKPLDECVDLEKMAKKTNGFSGAHIENIANESALIAIRNDRTKITQDDMDEALEKVIGGLKSKTTKLIEKEKQMVSYHEAGHALLGIKLGINKIQKISIIPHGEALGFVISLPEEDRFLSTKEDLENRLKMILAGRVAEEVKFGSYTNGASNDLQKATNIAMNMVCTYGMSDEIGLIAREMPRIDKLTEVEMKAVNNILMKAYKDTKAIILEDMERLTKIAEYLIENEEMSIEDLELLFENDLEMVSAIKM